MALVGEIVARFKAETTDYVAKLDVAKQKNKDLAEQLLKTAGSADKAIATLQSAKKVNALGEFGIDPRQVSGVISQIKALDKELNTAKNSAEDLQRSLSLQAKRAGGFGDLSDSIGMFARGDFLAGLEKFKKGIADVRETQGSIGGGFNALLMVGVVNEVGKAFDQMADKIVALHQKSKDGAMGWADYADAIASSLPVVGGFYNGTKKLVDELDGTNEALKKQADYLKAINTEQEKMNTLRGARNKVGDDNADAMAKARDTALRMSGREGEADWEQNTRETVKRIKDRQEALKTAYAEEIKALEDKRREALNNKDRDGATAASRLIEALKRKQQQELSGIASAEVAVSEAEWKKKYGDKTPAQADSEALAKKLVGTVKDQLQNNPIAQWIGAATDQLQKDGERLKEKASKFREDIKTDSQRFAEKINEAVSLKNMGLITGGQLDTYLGKTQGDLLKEQSSIMDSSKSVWNLPDVKDFRSGETLFAPPSRLDQKQLDRLTEIKEELKKLNEVQGGGTEVTVIE
jgi:hypothetical protein